MKLSLEIPAEIEERLNVLARKTGKEPRLLVQEMLEDTILDLEDQYLAEKILDQVESGEMSVRPFSEWEKDFDARHKVER